MFNVGDYVKIKSDVDYKTWHEDFVKYYDSLPAKQLKVLNIINDTAYLYVPGYNMENNEVVFIMIRNLELVSSKSSNVDWLNSIRMAAGR